MIPCLLGVDNLEKVWKFLVAIQDAADYLPTAELLDSEVMNA